MWLEAKKGVEYIKVPEIMIDDWVHKGHTKLKIFFYKRINSISSKQPKLEFWNRLDQKITFVCHLLTQTAFWGPNHTILTSSVNAVLIVMTNTIFLAPSLGVDWIFNLSLEGCPTKGTTLVFLFYVFKIWYSQTIL